MYPAAGAVENSTGLVSGAAPSRPRKDTSNHPANPVTGGAPFLNGKEKAVFPSPFVSSRLHVCKSSSGRAGRGDGDERIQLILLYLI